MILSSDARKTKAEPALPEFERMPRAFLRLTILMVPATAFAVYLFFWEALITDIAAITRLNPVGVLAFATNLYVFVCFWLVYFSTGWSKTLRAQSLRQLLMVHSNQWSEEPLQNEDEQTRSKRVAEQRAAHVDALREKARSTMMTQAIFIAMTVFILGALSRQPDLLYFSQSETIETTLLIGALTSAVLAFSLLLISTDAAETIFNSFKAREWATVATFYRKSARLKYYGFVLAFLSVALFAMTLNTFAASLALFVFMFAGYTYWFPDISTDAKYRYEGWLFCGHLLVLNMLFVWHAF